MPLKGAIAKVINGRDLSMEQAHEAMNIIMNGQATQAQIGSYLTALRMKGETVPEIAGSAAAMRAHVVGVKPQYNGMLADVVGTGGDGRNTFNISTTASFVVAGHGVKVAKHGNRGASSKSGSADVLMALGGNLEIGPEQVQVCVEEVGFGFMFAVKHHPAMRHAIGPRRELGQRTIFNILGPLTNPAGATHQLVGVFSPHLVETMARVLGELGVKGAFVVHGADGLDEFSTTGVNTVSHLLNGRVRNFQLDPLDYGIKRGKLEDIVGGEPDENAYITRAVLSGEDRGPRRDIVVLNAAALLSVECGDWAAGIQEAEDSIDSGRALATLDKWVAKTNSF